MSTAFVHNAGVTVRTWFRSHISKVHILVDFEVSDGIGVFSGDHFADPFGSVKLTFREEKDMSVRKAVLTEVGSNVRSLSFVIFDLENKSVCKALKRDREGLWACLTYLQSQRKCNGWYFVKS
jgi:hypothetical protein